MQELSSPSFQEWLEQGYRNGWVGPPVCEIHDGFPMSEDELSELDAGNDPCMHMLRLYETAEHKAAIENDHSPSVWRASNQGLIDVTKE